MIQKNKTKGTNLIHIKLEYEEALNSKRDILSSEMNLLRILKIMKRYHLLRSEELKSKLILHRKIKEIVAKIRKLQRTLPELEIPERLNNKNEKEIIKPKKIEERKKESQYDKSLESQLQEIQKKLRSISA